MLYSIFFIVSMLVFKVIARKDIQEVLQEHSNLNDYSIYAHGMPKKGLNLNQLHKHFSKFGEIHEIVFTY